MIDKILRLDLYLPINPLRWVWWYLAKCHSINLGLIYCSSIETHLYHRFLFIAKKGQVRTRKLKNLTYCDQKSFSIKILRYETVNYPRTTAALPNSVCAQFLLCSMFQRLSNSELQFLSLSNFLYRCDDEGQQPNLD